MEIHSARFGVVAAVVMLLAATGCGGSDDDEGSGGPPGGGAVPAQWEGYCVATFTEDTPIVEFDELLFTVRAGESYLLTSTSGFGNGIAAMAYLTPKGPYEFEVPAGAGGERPFTSNCTSGGEKRYYAAFTDVSVYADEALTAKLCDLTAGTVVPGTAGPSGYSSVDASFNGPSTYEVYLNGFAASCGGASVGYVSVPETQVFGIYTWLVPIISILGPP